MFSSTHSIELNPCTCVCMCVHTCVCVRIHVRMCMLRISSVARPHHHFSSLHLCSSTKQQTNHQHTYNFNFYFLFFLNQTNFWALNNSSNSTAAWWSCCLTKTLKPPISETTLQKQLTWMEGRSSLQSSQPEHEQIIYIKTLWEESDGRWFFLEESGTWWCFWIFFFRQLLWEEGWLSMGHDTGAIWSLGVKSNDAISHANGLCGRRQIGWKWSEGTVCGITNWLTTCGMF